MNNSYTKEDREKMLEADWQKQMPCSTCAIAEICKYRFAIKRIDFPPDVFDVSIKCKISSKYTKAAQENEDRDFARHVSLGG